MNEGKTQKGITLIALIITIIVLLILAVVAIGAVQNDGIIEYAKNARDKHETVKDNEQTILDSYLSEIEDSRIGKAIVGTKLTVKSTINGKEYSSTNPIIPAGFKAINTDTSKWDAEAGPEVTNGLVIQDDAGNEFVWVPVAELNSFARPISEGSEDYKGVLYNWDESGYPEYEWSENSANYREPDVVESYDGSYLSEMGVTKDLNKDSKVDIKDAKEQLQNEFNSMVKSVAKYKGFYVGRYEMSLSADKIAQSKKSTESNPIISSNASDSDTYMWYGLYSKAKTYTNVNNSVQSSMIWGCQYDAMIHWIGDDAHTRIGAIRNQTDKTGSVEKDKLKNVYDLYGNRFEWTLKARDNGNRVYVWRLRQRRLCTERS